MKIPIAYSFPIKSNISMDYSDTEALHVTCSVVLHIRLRKLAYHQEPIQVVSVR